MTDAATLYDQDFVTWTEQQAEALRAAARGGTNPRLDWENLAEEIESLGKSDRRELHRQTCRIVRHLAQLQFSEAIEPRDGWRESIIDGRVQAELVLADSPSLKPQLAQIIEHQTPKAMERAMSNLEKFGELDRAAAEAMRQTRYTVDQVLGDWFPPDLARSSGRGEKPE